VLLPVTVPERDGLPLGLICRVLGPSCAPATYSGAHSRCGKKAAEVVAVASRDQGECRESTPRSSWRIRYALGLVSQGSARPISTVDSSPYSPFFGAEPASSPPALLHYLRDPRQAPRVLGLELLQDLICSELGVPLPNRAYPDPVKLRPKNRSWLRQFLRAWRRELEWAERGEKIQRNLGGKRRVRS
jgi:hypothetical protein